MSTRSGHWDQLAIERRTSAPLIEDALFRAWMAGRPIFISSVMDDEMNPAQEVLRAWIQAHGGEAVMWEEITPRDQQANPTYLDGVDHSDLFVLLLGRRYGVADDSGYSPTHKESNRAWERGVPRLLFQPDGVRSSERDGKLNDWLGSLYSEVSGAKYSDLQDLTRKLENRLREIASAHETPWIKLGPFIFPGRITLRGGGNSRMGFEIEAHLRDRPTRRALAGDTRRLPLDRLTWGLESRSVERIDSIDIAVISASEDQVTIRGQLSLHGGGRYGFGGVTLNTSGRTYSPIDQIELWSNRMLFSGAKTSEEVPREFWGLVPDTGVSLPVVLYRADARGWLAEGIAQLFVVESLISQYGGYFDRLDVGPTTGAVVPLRGVYYPEGLQGASATIEGLVQLVK